MPVKTTLVVDDSKSARIMLSRMLQKIGLDVTMVESGEEAVEYMDGNSAPDVIFMDHMMPGMDGVQACKIISEKHDSPIYMYTSKEGPEYASEAKMAGATGILGKPAKMERLEEIIDELSGAPVAAEASEAPVAEATETPAVPTQETAPSEPTETASPVMSREQMESIAQYVVTEQLNNSIEPINDSIQALKSSIAEDQSEIRKLVSRQANTTSYVTQPVLDASIKQTATQFQSQITNEVKSLRDLIEKSTELSASDLDKIKELAVKSGAIAGAEQGEKSATGAAEAVAAKVSAAQAQIQVQQELAPLLKKLKFAQMLSVISTLVAIGAIASIFIA